MIPRLNEAKTLPLVIKSIPRRIKGISKVKILVIDDGSTDKTLEVAKKLKVDYFIRHFQRNRYQQAQLFLTRKANSCL